MNLDKDDLSLVVDSLRWRIQEVDEGQALIYPEDGVEFIEVSWGRSNWVWLMGDIDRLESDIKSFLLKPRMFKRKKLCSKLSRILSYF